MSAGIRYDMVLFDLDGTLLDTLQDLGDSVNHALAAAGYPPLGYDIYRSIVGKGIRNLCDKALTLSAACVNGSVGMRPEDGARMGDTPGRDALLERILGDFRTYYGEHLNEKTRPYPGAAEALREIRSAGAGLCVLSNKARPYTIRLVRDHFPFVDFRYIIGDGGPFPRKPDPSAIRFILSDSGTAPDRAILFGDGETDVRAARAAGIDAAAVLWGFRDREALAGAGAAHFLRSPDEMAGIVTGGIADD